MHQQPSSLNSLVSRLRADEGLRHRFVASPAAVLADEGFDVSKFNLPAALDAESLERRLAALDEDGADAWSVVETWRADDPDTLPDVVAVAIVIYGTSVVTGPVVVIGSGDTDKPDHATDLKALRALSRLPNDQVSFAVHGPDGLVANNLSRDVLEAYLSRTH